MFLCDLQEGSLSLPEIFLKVDKDLIPFVAHKSKAHLKVDAIPVVDLQPQILGLRLLNQEVELLVPLRAQRLGFVLLQGTLNGFRSLLHP